MSAEDQFIAGFLGGRGEVRGMLLTLVDLMEKEGLDAQQRDDQIGEYLVSHYMKLRSAEAVLGVFTVLTLIASAALASIAEDEKCPPGLVIDEMLAIFSEDD